MLTQTLRCAHCGGERLHSNGHAKNGKLRSAYKTGLVFTDFWEAYQKVVPQEQHRATGKGDGQTNHIERFNNVLRQRLAWFVRQTLSFSKIDTMHETCLRVFLFAGILARVQSTNLAEAKEFQTKLSHY